MSFDADGKPTLYRELVQAAYATADRQGVDVETTPEWRAAQIIGCEHEITAEVMDNSVFGNWVRREYPPGTDIVVIGTCTGPNGIVPRRLVLPHQTYVSTMQSLAREHDARDVVLIPAKSSEYLMFPRADVDAWTAKN